MQEFLRSRVANRVQKIFWIYLTNNFVITGVKDYKEVAPALPCDFLPITSSNYIRVRDFREERRVREYHEKVDCKEIGFFATNNGKMVGSIWATLNNTGLPMIARSYMKLMPNEALVHDIVTGEEFRGMGVGAFMVGRIASKLLGDYGAHKVVIDVNFRNRQSMRMMEKAGLPLDQQVLSISAFGRLISQNVLKQYS
jgi:RimJ/RimL family protein N-acetyltransferase